MPYKDLAKQREYLRTWRRNQKLRTARSPVRHIVHNEPAYHGRLPQPAVPRILPAVDHSALKMSPDGIPQTGREATLAYRANRLQLTTPRTTPKSTKIRRPPVVLLKMSNRHCVMPIAATVVELLSHLF